MSALDTFQSGGAGAAPRLRNASIVIVAAVLVLAPLKPGFILPILAPTDDLSLEVSALVGATLGAGVYWSLPRRTATRHRAGGRMRMQIVTTFVCAMLGVLLLCAASLLLSEESIMTASFGDATIYGIWCSLLVTAAAMVIEDPGRRRVGRSRRSPRAERTPMTAAVPIAPLAPSLRAERDCPWCAERILSRAKVCKFCGHDVEVS
ncbi:MAG: hypothetical protein ABJD07_15055 [Gemmatimonadaceae bacterium]